MCEAMLSMGGNKSLGFGTAPSCGHGVQTIGTHWDPFVHAPGGVPRGSTTESQNMERMS